MEKQELVIIPIQTFLKECFEYDCSTGFLKRKIRPLEHFSNKRNMNYYNNNYGNKIITRTNMQGYIRVHIDGINYRAHRLIWKLHYGTEPPDIIDHINGIKDDNRIENLREVTIGENGKNRTKPKIGSRYEYIGAIKHNGRWVSSITHNKISIFIGSFDTQEEAALAYQLKYIELYGEEFYYANENNKTLLEELKLKVEEIKKNKVIKIFNKEGNYIGVTKRINKFSYNLQLNNKTYIKSGYKTKEEAVLARELKMLEILGEEEYTKQNRMSLLEELKEKVDVIKQERNSMI
jgi:hypothetical protein